MESRRLFQPVAVRSLFEFHVFPERPSEWRCNSAARFPNSGRSQPAISPANALRRDQGLFTAGANYHDNQINVGLYPRIGRNPLGVTDRANVRVTNGAGYAQQNLSFFSGRLLASAGLRYDVFRFDVQDRVQSITAEPKLPETGSRN